MAVPIEKAPTDVEKGRFLRDASSSISAVNSIDKSDCVLEDKSVHQVTDEQYPHGSKLVLLAGASIIAVFLIALDQVSKHPSILTK